MVDASAIGLELPPTHARVEPGRLRFFLDTMGETNPIYRDDEAAKAAGFAGASDPADLSLLPGDDRPRAIRSPCSKR